MKVIVTGGVGFIGSHLLDALVSNNNYDIYVVDNCFRGSEENISHLIKQKGLQFIQVDIRNKSALETVFRGADLVYHLAAQSNVIGATQDLDYSFSTNVIGTYNVLSVSRDAGVKRVIFTSSREVYGEPKSLPVNEKSHLEPKNAYGASKVAGEAYCRVFSNTGLQVVVLRLSNVFGPRDYGRVIPIFIDNILQEEPLIIYGEDKLLDFIWVGDVVNMLLNAGFRTDWINKPVNIGSGVGIKIKELATHLVDLMESDVEIMIADSRIQEVTGYVADTRRMQKYFGMILNDSHPFSNLIDVIKSRRAKQDGK